jgi:hypothetical protein
MNVSFRVVPVSYERFAPLFELRDAELQAMGARRMTVDENPGFPCRASLVDAEIGETVLLVPFVHHEACSPYRASGPIFIRKDAGTAHPAVDEIPAMLRQRLLSVRAYDASATMIAAQVTPGTELESVIHRFFAEQRARYLHIHNAGPGCYNCSVIRA